MVQHSATQLDQVFHALSDPTRRAILTQLAGGETSVSHLATPSPMSLTAVSKHLRVLEEAKLVTRRRQGRESVCSLQPAALSDAWQWIGHYREFWEAQIDALDRYFEQRRNNSGG